MRSHGWASRRRRSERCTPDLRAPVSTERLRDTFQVGDLGNLIEPDETRNIDDFQALGFPCSISDVRSSGANFVGAEVDL